MNRALGMGKIMKIAIPTWNGRVSPVMDTARLLMIVEQSAGHEVSKTTVEIPVMGVSNLAQFLKGLRIDALICGAISHQLEQMLIAAGVKSYPWYRGGVDEIVAAYSGGFLHNEDFLLPGGRRRGRRGGRCRRGRTNFGANTQTEEKS